MGKYTSLMSLLVVGAFLATSMVSIDAEAKKRKTARKPAKVTQPKKKAVKKPKKADALCAADVATTSMYYVPHVKDLCKNGKICAKFKDAVANKSYGAGTGTLSDGRVYRYNGKIETLKPGCKTAQGATGRCLTPFISVAADMDYFDIGDIIKMPSLKGKEITMPDGKVFKHPGYLVVEDTGGAIKGPNRFDFFTGALGQYNKKNEFGSSGSWEDPVIVDQRSCTASKKFAKLTNETTEIFDAQEDIASFMSDISGGGGKVMLASAGNSVKGNQ